MRWKTSSSTPSPGRASPPAHLTTVRSGPSVPRVLSACRRALRYASSTRYRRARTAPPRCSSVWSAPASACCGSSSTTRAVPTRIWPSSPIRSTPCAISGTTERLNNCTGKQNRKTGSPVVSWNHRAACLHVEKMENVTDRRPFRTGACVQSGWGGPWHLRRHNQSPTGALVAASRRPAGIPPGPDAAASPLDIPGGWDPRTNQQPTGLLIALPAAVPCCSNPSGS